MSDPEPRFVRVGRARIARADRDVAYLVDTLRDPDPEVRGRALRYLRELAASETSPQLMPLLHAGAPEVRAAAARTLGEFRAEEAVEPLLELARSDRASVVRREAIDAIGAIGKVRAVPQLVELLRDPAWEIRDRAARALAAIRDPAALPALAAAYAREPRLRRGRRRVLAAAYEIIRHGRGYIPDEASFPRLIPVALLCTIAAAAFASLDAPLWLKTAAAASALGVWLRYYWNVYLRGVWERTISREEARRRSPQD